MQQCCNSPGPAVQGCESAPPCCAHPCWCLQAKKHLGPKLLQTAAAMGIDIRPVLVGKPLREQGPFDILLHKVRRKGEQPLCQPEGVCSVGSLRSTLKSLIMTNSVFVQVCAQEPRPAVSVKEAEMVAFMLNCRVGGRAGAVQQGAPAHAGGGFF